MKTKKKIKTVIVPLKLVRIEKNGCHLTLSLLVNKCKALMVVDTGASQTVFDKSRVEELLGHDNFEDVSVLSTGLGTSSMKSHMVKIPQIDIGRLQVKNKKFVVLDLSHVNRAFEMMKIKPVDGVIGGDLLKKYKAVIDYGKKEMVLKIP